LRVPATTGSGSHLRYDPGMAQDDPKHSRPPPPQTLNPWKKFSCAPLSP